MVAIAEPSRPTRRALAPPCVGSGACARDKTPDPGTDRNQQYSVTALTDGGGAIIERYAYTAYGQMTFANASGSEISNSAISNRYTYTGREWDEGLQLYHYRARMYDAVAGRFCTRDPIGYVDGTNRYAYLALGVLYRLDPSGLESVDELCQRKKQEYIANRVPELKTICPRSDFQVECKSCGEDDVNNGVLGRAECKSKLTGGQNHTLVICLDAIKQGRTEEQAKQEIITTILHEDQHVADRCSCSRGCNAFAYTVADLKPGGIPSFCQRFYCTEVRAHSIDGSCDGFANEGERIACIKERIKTLYPKPHEKCTDTDLDEAVNKCYIPQGQSPTYPMPIN